MTLLFLASLSQVVSTGIKEHLSDPQITDAEGDAFGYIDIDSVWFYENEETPDFLYVAMKINEPSEFTFQQTFACFWTYDDVRYSVALHLGFDVFEWQMYDAGKYEKRDQNLQDVNGSYNFDSGVITWIVPKEYVGNPQQGDILTNTWSNAFRRLGVIGRVGFTRIILDSLILQLFGNNMWDYAPERGEYGLTYTIQY